MVAAVFEIKMIDIRERILQIHLVKNLVSVVTNENIA